MKRIVLNLLMLAGIVFGSAGCTTIFPERNPAKELYQESIQVLDPDQRIADSQSISLFYSVSDSENQETWTCRIAMNRSGFVLITQSKDGKVLDSMTVSAEEQMQNNSLTFLARQTFQPMEAYSGYEAAGTADVRGVPCNVLKLTPKEEFRSVADEVLYFVDPVTRQCLRQEYRLHVAENGAPLTQTIDFLEYRISSGLFLPGKIKTGDTVFQLQKVSLNTMNTESETSPEPTPKR